MKNSANLEIRPTGLDGAPAFDEGLSGMGIEDVELLRWRLPEASPCTVRSWRPRVPGHDAPDPAVLLGRSFEREKLRSWEDAERSCFEFDGQTLRIRTLFAEGTHYYGLGMATGRLERTGRTCEFWNTDAWCYGDHTRALYQSHPFVLVLLPDGTAQGLLALTPRRGLAQVAANGVEFSFEGDSFELARIEGPGALDVLRCLSRLIGGVADLPVWALGYHQCRWGYASEHEFRELAREFRERKLPCDALWFDIDYMDAHRVFTFDAERFPAPGRLLEELGAAGFRTVAILDPGVARGYPLYDEGAERGHFVVDGQGHIVHGRVWPGICAFPDFLDESARDWWASRVQRFLRDAPFDGLWCDMNEPALFKTPGGTLPLDARHGEEEHARVHNLYGAEMARATRAGFEAARPGVTPFLLSRANHVAGARYAAAWTGDNQALWHDLRIAVTQVANLGLSGQPISGPDIGGFSGDPAAELFVRWFELGLLLPFFRGHSERTACRKEPWCFGPEVETHVRRLLEERQAWLPQLLGLAHEAVRFGLPILRPLALADPADPRLREVDDAFLIGDALLAAPALEPTMNERTLTLPRGTWFSWDANRSYVGGGEISIATPLGTLPLFVRAGSILFRSAPGQTTDATGLLPKKLHVFLESAPGSGSAASGAGVTSWQGSDAVRDLRLLRVEVRPAAAGQATGGWTLELDRPLTHALELEVHFAESPEFPESIGIARTSWLATIEAGQQTVQVTSRQTGPS